MTREDHALPKRTSKLYQGEQKMAIINFILRAVIIAVIVYTVKGLIPYVKDILEVW